MLINMVADKVKVYGPKVDGGYSVTFEVGEYQADMVAELVKIKGGRAIKLTVEVENDR